MVIHTLRELKEELENPSNLTTSAKRVTTRVTIDINAVLNDLIETLEKANNEH